MAEPILSFVFTSHALEEMARRGIDEGTVRRVLVSPEQRLSLRPGRDMLQSKLDFSGTPYLVRVFVDIDRTPAEVVTAYRTSKIAKYWRNEP